MRTCEACCYRTCRTVKGLILRVLPLLAALVLVEASYSQTVKLGWSYPPATPLRVHIVRGSAYYDRDYRIEEVLAHAGANLFTESTQADRGSSESDDSSASDAGWLWRYADPRGHVMNHHLVVVSNISAKSFGKNQQVLVDFVKHGGSVLFLCGSSSFGERSEKSDLAEMVPFSRARTAMHRAILPLTFVLFVAALEHLPGQEESAESGMRGSRVEDRAARKLLEAGSARYDADEVSKAVEIWQSVIERYPRSRVRFQAHTLLGSHFLERDRSYDLARTHFEAAASEENTDLDQRADAMLNIGICYYQAQCYYKLEDFLEAAETFDRFVKIFPDDELAADALFWAGESYREGRRNPEAFQRYNRCRWDFPESDAAKYARGRLAMPEMMRLFEQAAELDD